MERHNKWIICYGKIISIYLVKTILIELYTGLSQSRSNGWRVYVKTIMLMLKWSLLWLPLDVERLKRKTFEQSISPVTLSTKKLDIYIYIFFFSQHDFFSLLLTLARLLIVLWIIHIKNREKSSRSIQTCFWYTGSS